MIVWILVGLITLVITLAAVDLFVLKRGDPMDWFGVTTYRLRLGSWLPRLLGSGGTTIGNEVHIAGPRVTAWLLSHEVAHVVRGRALGTRRYLWRYLTSKRFRVDEELACNLWAQLHHEQTHPRWAAGFMRKGGS